MNWQEWRVFPGMTPRLEKAMDGLQVGAVCLFAALVAAVPIGAAWHLLHPPKEPPLPTVARKRGKVGTPNPMTPRLWILRRAFMYRTADGSPKCGIGKLVLPPSAYRPAGLDTAKLILRADAADPAAPSDAPAAPSASAR